MQLSPSRYVCSQDGIDLTKKVEELVGEDVPLSSGIFDRKRPSKRPFKVIVECPGTKEGGPHSVVFKGEVVG